MSKNFLPFHIPEIGEDEIHSVVETFRSGWLTTGHKCKQFEADFARPLLAIALSLLLWYKKDKRY